MSGPTPFVFDDTGEAKRHAPATQRNRDAITDVLRDYLPDDGLVLEIASGTGEHAVHFARFFPHLSWQPTDMEDVALASIAAWSQEAALDNLREPVKLDVIANPWPVESADAILCINMVHISSWEATLALFAGAANTLASGGLLYLYGPFTEEGIPTSESNLAFDESLKNRNPAWGLRSVEAVAEVAREQGFTLTERVAMPANNLSLLFIDQ